jgi:uncharacterized protein
VVTANVTARWVGECRRCARAIGGELSVPVKERFLEHVTDEDDAYPLEGDLLDLADLVRDALILELPLAPLCRDDCKGLCVTCGADLNEADCGCGAPIDPRWANLDALREPDGETQGN